MLSSSAAQERTRASAAALVVRWEHLQRKQDRKHAATGRLFYRRFSTSPKMFPLACAFSWSSFETYFLASKISRSRILASFLASDRKSFLPNLRKWLGRPNISVLLSSDI